MELNELTALSPLDGRYGNKTAPLRNFFSEYALMYHRVQVEIEWLKCLAATPEISEVAPLTSNAQNYLEEILANFSLQDAQTIKSLEKTTNHDMKAVEYFLKEHCEKHAELSKVSEFIHFACTSEDINNLAYALMLKESNKQNILPKIQQILKRIQDIAHKTSNIPMLARTHGQPATPTTLGKEMANVHHRLVRQWEDLNNAKFFGKCNGAVGNYNAHVIAYPEVNWPALSKSFVEGLGLTWNSHTTQIEPHDDVVKYLLFVSFVNSTLMDFCRDVWGYISLNYFQQKTVETEVGSSTMPHKVNPIDFENAEGNLALANGLIHCLANRLPQSRWQRDLVDSTLLRNLGVVMGHSYIAYESLLKGIEKLVPNTAKLEEDLNDNWEVLAEAIQTIMRRYHVDKPYEKLKALTRGKKLEKTALLSFIESLPIPEDAKHRLKELTPQKYIGLAPQLAKEE